MRSITLDTSCALNFLNPEEQADESLIRLMRLAVLGRVDVVVTEEALSEVGRTEDASLREERLARLRVFSTLRVPPSAVSSRDALAQDLLARLFASASRSSRQGEHNERDCRQLASHAVIGRDLFVSLDKKLVRKAALAATSGITLANPSQALTVIEGVEQPATTWRPTISVRRWERERDEGDIRSILQPLHDLYPEFDDWLTSRLAKPDSHFLIGEFEGRPGAVSLTVRKDTRVVKLAAFMVAEFARNTGLGPHLLWTEIRRWVQMGYEKAYVTVSSRRADLLRFFVDFGFLIEGVSPRRYFEDEVEFVLGKHLLRERISDSSIDTFLSEVAPRIFQVPAEAAKVESSGWTLPTMTEGRLYVVDGEGVTLHQQTATTSRRWGDLELERLFHPLRIVTSDRRALLVPIEQQWADALLEYPEQQRPLMRDESEKLLLRWDNAYYCFPKSLDLARPGTPILFYVKAPVMGVVGEARILDAELDRPQYLFLDFGDLGVYTLEQIQRHVQTRGRNSGRALALRFGMYVPFVRSVPLTDLRNILGHARFTGPQGLMPISIKDFEETRERGGLSW